MYDSRSILSWKGEAHSPRWLTRAEVADHVRRKDYDPIIRTYVNLVLKVAQRYRRHPLGIDEFVSEGMAALCVAVRGFDPDNGANLTTYATHCLRGAMAQHAFRNQAMVPLGPGHGTVYWAIIKHSAASDEDIAQMTKTSARVVAAVRAAWYDVRDDPVHHDDELGGISFVATIPDPNADTASGLDQRERRDEARRVIGVIMSVAKDDRERDIISRRILTADPVTLGVIGQRWSITRERVRQIEKMIRAEISQIDLASADHAPPSRRKPTRSSRGKPRNGIPPGGLPQG